MPDTQHIAALLQQADRPLSTNAVADRAGVEWHTAKDRLEQLEDDHRAHRKEMSNRLTLWFDKSIPL